MSLLAMVSSSTNGLKLQKRPTEVRNSKLYLLYLVYLRFMHLVYFRFLLNININCWPYLILNLPEVRLKSETLMDYTGILLDNCYQFQTFQFMSNKSQEKV